MSAPPQDPGCRALDVLKPLQTPAEEYNEECTLLIQSGGDKGVDQLFSIREGESGAEFGNDTEVK